MHAIHNNYTAHEHHLPQRPRGSDRGSWHSPRDPHSRSQSEEKPLDKRQLDHDKERFHPKGLPRVPSVRKEIKLPAEFDSAVFDELKRTVNAYVEAVWGSKDKGRADRPGVHLKDLILNPEQRTNDFFFGMEKGRPELERWHESADLELWMFLTSTCEEALPDALKREEYQTPSTKFRKSLAAWKKIQEQYVVSQSESQRLNELYDEMDIMSPEFDSSVRAFVAYQFKLRKDWDDLNDQYSDVPPVRTCTRKILETGRNKYQCFYEEKKLSYWWKHFDKMTEFHAENPDWTERAFKDKIRLLETSSDGRKDLRLQREARKKGRRPLNVRGLNVDHDRATGETPRSQEPPVPRMMGPAAESAESAAQALQTALDVYAEKSTGSMSPALVWCSALSSPIFKSKSTILAGTYAKAPSQATPDGNLWALRCHLPDGTLLYTRVASELAEKGLRFRGGDKARGDWTPMNPNGNDPKGELLYGDGTPVPICWYCFLQTDEHNSSDCPKKRFKGFFHVFACDKVQMFCYQCVKPGHANFESPLCFLNPNKPKTH